MTTSPILPNPTDRKLVTLGPVSCVAYVRDLPNAIPELLARVNLPADTLSVRPYTGPIDPANGPVWRATTDQTTTDNLKAFAPKITPVIVARGADALRAAAPTVVRAIPVASVPSDAIDADGKVRAERDQATAIRNGFALGKQLFDTGTHLYDIGVDNARRERKAWEDLPIAGDALRAHASAVRAEDRRDVTIPTDAIYMLPDGTIARTTWERDASGKYSATGSTPIGAPSEPAYASLAIRMGIPADSRCTSAHPIVRGPNVNAWATGRAHPTQARPTGTVVLGTRRNGSAREVYRAVSEGYGDLGSDLVSEALARAVDGSGGRVALAYNGTRTQARVIYHTNVPADRTVVGEILQAWVGLSTDDTGGGSIGISAGIFHVLCKNLGHVKPESMVARIRHVGDVGKLARSLRDAIANAQGMIGDYVNAWNVATDDDLRAQSWVKDFKRATDHEFLAAIFRGLATRDDRVHVALASHASPARLETTVRDLVGMVGKDRSSATATHGPTTRAAIVNAFTRFAHEGSDVDPWQGEAIERAGSALLYTDRPLPMLHPEDLAPKAKRTQERS